MKIYGMSHAGGTIDFYRELKEILHNRGIEFCPVEYSGHGQRKNENFYDSIKHAASDILNIILKDLSDDQSYCLFGYSMGCLVVNEIVNEIARHEGGNFPKYVFLAAHEPIEKKCIVNKYTEQDIEYFIRNEIIRLGGIPEKLYENSVFWRMYMPMYKSDYKMIWNYKLEKYAKRHYVDAVILYSKQESNVEIMKGWNDFFAVKGIYGYEEKHFFLKENVEQISKIICDKMKRLE